MAKLNPKDLSFNWHQPKIHPRGASSIPEDLILIKNVERKNQQSIYYQRRLEFRIPSLLNFFKGQLQPGDDLRKVKDKLKMSVMFEKDKQLIFVFDPPVNAPGYKFGIIGSGLSINNSDLIESIYDHLGLEKNHYYLKGKIMMPINGMTPVYMTPIDYETRLPIFEEDLLGK